MVSSSGSAFPRHSAWSHGVGTPCDACLVLRRDNGCRGCGTRGLAAARHPYQAGGGQAHALVVMNFMGFDLIAGPSS